MKLGDYITQRSSGATFIGIEGKGIECDLIQAAAFLSDADWNATIARLKTQHGQTLIWLGEGAEPDYVVSPTNEEGA